MNNITQFIMEHFKLQISERMPIEIPDFDRIGLTYLFSELKFKSGAEIGIERGVFSKEICLNNPGVKLHCVDPWKHSTEYRGHVSQEMLDGFFKQTTESLAPYGCNIIRAISSEAVKQFEDESLDFVYIDANHEYTYVMEDLTNWSKKVRVGGIISGHDYVREHGGAPGVIQAVNDFTKENDIAPWFLLGLKDKIRGMKRDRSRSYMWVKE